MRTISHPDKQLEINYPYEKLFTMLRETGTLARKKWLNDIVMNGFLNRLKQNTNNLFDFVDPVIIENEEIMDAHLKSNFKCLIFIS